MTPDIPSDPHAWIEEVDLESTAQVRVPDKLIDQVIGQDEAVAVARKAAEQKRHLLMIGPPGTGKSMLARAMTEILPEETVPDVLALHDEDDPNHPRIRTVEGGRGGAIVESQVEEAQKALKIYTVAEWGLALGMIALGIAWLWLVGGMLVFLFATLVAMFFLYLAQQNRPETSQMVPNLLVARDEEETTAPYVDATGSHAGALLGDVRHDPFQSGGLETPTHERVEPGAIHRAHKGVLYVDEINTLRKASQQALLTAIQEGEYSIVGRSESSSGAMVRTEPVPCDFVLVAAGNLDAIEPEDPLQDGMHPALRSRIQGYGYEVYVNRTMPDTHRNRGKLIRFVAQEVERDGRIPHFDMAATAEIIREAQRRAGRTGRLTLRLRELGGLVRTAGDIAHGDGADTVRLAHVREAKRLSRSLEQQITDREVEASRADEALQTSGEVVGSAKGLAVLGTGDVGEPAGLVVPVEAAVSPGSGDVVAGDILDRVAPSAADRLAPTVAGSAGDAMADADLHVDALVEPRDALDAGGIQLAGAVAAISAVEAVPVRQDVALFGALAVSGEVRRADGVTQAVEAAVDVGYDAVVVPEGCLDDVLLGDDRLDEVDLVTVDRLEEALAAALVDDPARDEIVAKVRG